MRILLKTINILLINSPILLHTNKLETQKILGIDSYLVIKLVKDLG